MMSKNFLNYLKYSGVWISFALNPYHWRVSFEFKKPDDMDPSMYAVYATIGPLAVRLVLDNGSW